MYLPIIWDTNENLIIEYIFSSHNILEIILLLDDGIIPNTRGCGGMIAAAPY
jgi:hypothetical protein